MPLPKPLLLTPGDPAGIGPDITLASWSELSDVVVIADADVLQQRAQLLGLNAAFTVISDIAQWQPGHPHVLHQPLNTACQVGVGSPDHASYVLACLQTAVDHCLQNRAHGLVTGPVNKEMINRGGVVFSGHTEWLAAATATPKVVMMLACPALKVALVTTHIPLAEVSHHVTFNNCVSTFRIVDNDLRTRFGIAQPRLLVTGLNPHAGEGGYLGREDIDVIAPAIAHCQQLGMTISGPASADTAFNPSQLAASDCVICMYHDQGLPVLKYAGFGQAVNVTLGLPIIRTSVDHGTAYALAGTGNVDSGSCQAAITMAQHMKREHEQTP